MSNRFGPVSFKRFERFLLSVGCKRKRITGRHVIYTCDGAKRAVVVPRKKEVTPGVIRANLKTLEISIKEYLASLR